ncbi:MAG: hypothetical protein AB1476_04895 [Candidatus Hadarchaeota archaeon]
MKLDGEDGGTLPSEKNCVACGRRGYYLENGLCLDCIEAELRRSFTHSGNGLFKGGFGAS